MKATADSKHAARGKNTELSLQPSAEPVKHPQLGLSIGRGVSRDLEAPLHPTTGVRYLGSPLPSPPWALFTPLVRSLFIDDGGKGPLREDGHFLVFFLTSLLNFGISPRGPRSVSRGVAATA
ncbi:hypothetical protein COCON_G00177230 [Conger conger]|uniref:Uncharacterized protein n=1 Tax=Conger conger TaxID=82655 RepID=A0A9Q1D506_CONCO|nr:hypothetical protein COCON_G00177230 [Conger conger]